jgi:long-chain acyl-CoA synthetase
VPLYDTFGQDAIKFILNQTKMAVVVVAEDKLASLLAVAPACPSLRYVIKIGALNAGNSNFLTNQTLYTQRKRNWPRMRA